MNRYPSAAFRTPCVPGCAARIEWEYDPGEPSSRDEPGSPPWWEPSTIGNDPTERAAAHTGPRDAHPHNVENDHLIALANDPPADLDILLWQWDELRSTAQRMANSSRWYLMGRVPANRAEPRVRLYAMRPESSF